MKKRLTTLILLICISALAASSVFAEEEKTIVKRPKPKFTVCVQVACQDDSLEFKLLSLRKRELRKIDDVTVVGLEEKPQYIISLVAVKNKVGGKETGYSYSYSFFKKHYYSAELHEAIVYFNENIYAKMSEEEQEKLSKLYFSALENNREYTEYLHGGIQTIPSDVIENVCKSEVAYFNQNILEPLRKENKEAKKIDKSEGVKTD